MTRACLTIYTPAPSKPDKHNKAWCYAARISRIQLPGITVTHRELPSLAAGKYTLVSPDADVPEVVVLDGHGFWLTQEDSPYTVGGKRVTFDLPSLIRRLPRAPSALILGSCNGGQWEVRRALHAELEARGDSNSCTPILAARGTTWDWQALWLYPTLAWRLSRLQQPPSGPVAWACLMDWALLDAATLSTRGDLARRQGHRQDYLPKTIMPVSGPDLFDTLPPRIKGQRKSSDASKTLRELAFVATSEHSADRIASMWNTWSVSM